MNVCPPAVIVPERCGPVLAATLYWTVPLPVPVAPAVTVSQFTLLFAAHPQPSADLTSNVPDAPAAGAEADVAERENAHPWP